MPDSPDRIELQPPMEGHSNAKRAPFALLAALGVGVATAAAALASFAVGSNDAQPQGRVPERVTPAADSRPTTGAPGSSAEVTPDATSTGSTSVAPTSAPQKQQGEQRTPEKPANPGTPGGGGTGGGGGTPGGGGGVVQPPPNPPAPTSPSTPPPVTSSVTIPPTTTTPPVDPPPSGP